MRLAIQSELHQNKITMRLKKSRQNFFPLIATLAFMGACTSPSDQTDTTANVESTLEALVTAEWLSEHLDDPDLVVLDCTVLIEVDENGAMLNSSGRANYAAGHIPSAGFADLKGDLSDLDGPLEFGMPTPEQFSAAMGALGVGDNSRVVLYSANQGVWAARVWWMLRWAGFDRVALLDGGLEAWVADGRPLSTETSNRPAQQFNVELRPELIVDRDQVLAGIDSGNVSLVDAMPDAHYRGDFALYDRPGHILGATSMPSTDHLDETGRYRSFDELDMMHDGDRDGRVVTYCGGGVAASSVAFTMHRLGFTNVGVYMGSLEEWAADPANPMTRIE